ncbi:hypothetical protein D0Z07_7908 [Hyphodiscus hymeniophilus]|uniref:IgE-binding protein n=1 Tax=Hyphodiscus hymeniophilus TaxID=353542 RepID=A0A9P6SQW4_9HELO|nr:hypothetical protein D0Z07_7908 [Hyphodiscus hymeniophilus]
MALLKSLFAIVFLWFTFAAAQSVAGQFTLTIYQPSSALHGQIVNAAGEAFHLGGSPASYCPLTNLTLCPAGNQTIFAGMGAMFVEVPGGQEVYTTSAGAISYTQAHSASIPPNAYIGDFTNVTVMDNYSAPVYLVNWQAPQTVNSTKGILACPQVAPGNSTTVVYQVYANTPAFNQTNCTLVDGLLPHYTPPGVIGAWE